MRSQLSLLVAIGSLLLLAGGATAQQSPDRGGIASDDPSGREEVTGLDGDGYAYVEAFLGKQSPASAEQRRARNVSLVGALQLSPFNEGVHADVAGFEDLAFVGKWRGACPATGVDIIDISNPAAPVKIADTLDHPNTSMEDMDAIEIGERDVLAVGLQDCTFAAGTSGLELYDITNPRRPELLSFFDTDELPSFGVNLFGVHELDLTTTPSGRALALLAVPDLEFFSNFTVGFVNGDLLILDITDPAHPTLVGEWGVIDEPALGFGFYFDARRGVDARTLGHSVRANANGTRAYLSYWDAGVITLDISDPAHPTFLGRTAFAGADEGNAHSAVEARGGTLLVQADEDLSPFGFGITSNAFAGTRAAVEAAFTSTRLASFPGGFLTGEVVHVGRGCPAGSIVPGSAEDPYLADPAGKIALIERGACRFDNKIARANLAGALGAIVYNDAAGGEGLVLMVGNDPVTLPDGTVVDITIPAVFVQRSTGLLLREASPPITARVGAIFNGWGFLRIFDVKDPANPVQLATFATANTTNEAVANDGVWSVHNPEVRGTTVYASWYSDGVRVLDISQPSAPREIGSWTGEGAPDAAPRVNIWSVVPHEELLLASDRNFGLYILKQTP